MALAQPQPEPARPRRITIRSIILGTITAALLNIYSDYTGMILGSASLVKSQLSMAMLLPFVAWLVINLILKLAWPRMALRSTELLVIYSMSWIVGTVSASGWTTYWGGVVSTPFYYASPENRWEEVLFDFLPWWCLPQATPEIIRTYYEGLPDGASIPWRGWLASLHWWFAVSIALVVAGLCLAVIFQKQWEENERLTFPLAAFPIALTEGFDEPGRVIPGIFRNKLFWVGFFVVFGVFAWNILGYFAISLPRIGIYDGYLTKEVPIARNFPSFYLRILPPVLGLTYMCNLDILFSFWAFRLIAIVKEGVMARTGFNVGLSGQQAEASEILILESHGAFIFLAVWAIWVARGHLRDVLRAAVTGEADDGLVSYRLALLGFIAATIFVFGWFVAVGLSPFLALFHLLLLYAAYFTVAKYTAASGFSYLFPVGGKGGQIVEIFTGTATLTQQNTVALGVINSSAFFGNSRIPAWPALPHHLKLLGNDVRRRWVFWIVLLAFASGFFGSCLFIVHLGYNYAGQNLGLSGFSGSNIRTYDRMVAAIVGADKTVFDPGKIAVWIFGVGQAGLLMLLRNRIPWWPLHPLGLAFQKMSGSRVYAFSIFLTWASKLIILRIGGISLYRRCIPLFFGLVIGYVVGVGVSSIVDFTFFPEEGHSVHGW